MGSVAKTSKKKRDHKVSKGEHGGGGKVRLTNIEKVLLGKGLLSKSKPVTPITHPWLGAEGVPEPFDREQARENQRLYPHLFSGR